ncbi:unnamed protein product, partial [Mesorhabditis belari]|uniref:Trafficking protein particle complex subunit 11 domain-containing protein n=1 Tax=Mesorhabditis belari TaxID=2138241 RepID=A0AAF3E9C7_9BILA
MDPVEPGDWVTGRPQQLILLTGLDPTNRPLHNVLLAAFYNRTPDRPAFKVRLIAGDADLPQKTKKKKTRGILRKEWPNKYLNHVPALVVLFMDLDWDHPSWSEKLLEASSKTESLRNSIQHESRLLVVLLQEKTTSFPSEGEEKANEFCHHCQMSSKQLFVVNTAGDLSSHVGKLELAFHEHAQAFYQAKIKTIRSRSIPNNSPELLVRQMFKLGFLSELRQDTHTALRNYKLAYDHCQNSQNNWEMADYFEWRSVAGLLNYKICELYFLHNTPRDAITLMNKHMSAFFYGEPGNYPSAQLAGIEYSLWKSKQSWQFAELFERAVVNGLTAVAAVNPGTFLDYASTHFATANRMIRELKATSPISASYPNPDPLASAVDFYGQRPWRVGPLDTATALHLERAAIFALQLRLHENHDGLMTLLSAASMQYKKYGCPRLHRKIMIESGDAQAAAGKPEEALKLWTHVLREGTLPENLRLTLLNKALWSSYCNVLLKETMWSVIQLLRVEPSGTLDPLHQEIFMKICDAKTPANPFSTQLAENQVQHISMLWKQKLEESQFFTVNCSKLSTFVQVSACFLQTEPVSVDMQVPLRVTLTLQTSFPITFSGVRVSAYHCESSGRRIGTADDQATFNVFRSNITLQPFTPSHFYFAIDLKDSASILKEGHLVTIGRVSLEIGDRTQKGVFSTFEWDGNALGRERLNLLDLKAYGQQLSVRVVNMVGTITNIGDKNIDCLLAEIASAKLRLKNETNRELSDVRIEFKRSEQASSSASSVLFVDDDNELRGELELAVASSMKPGDEVDRALQFSSQLHGSVDLLLESAFKISGEKEVQKGRVALTITSEDPFIVRSQVLTLNGIPVTKVLNRSTHLLKVDLKSNADIEITRIDWLLADVVQNALSIYSENDLPSPDVLLKGDVVSYCTPIDIFSQEDSEDEKPLGRMVVFWRRCGSSFSVRSTVPLCRTVISTCPVSINVEVGAKIAEMRKPLLITYVLLNNTLEVIEATTSFDLTDTFMFSGDKLRSVRLLPGVPLRIEVTVMALAAGRLSFPRLTIRSPSIADSILLDALRNLPATIFVLPLAKEYQS